MTKKHKNQLRALVLALTVVGALLWHFDKLGSANLRFQTYALFSEQNISAAELSKVIALHEECFENDRRKNLFNYYLEVQHPHSDESFRKYLRERVETIIQEGRLQKKSIFRRKENVTLLRKGSELIGLFSCAPEQRISHGSSMIYDVCLASKMRGKGLGQQLMEQAIRQCQEVGKDLTLMVYKDNTPAIALYKKLNFSLVPMPGEAGDDFEYFNKYFMVFQPRQK